MPDEAIWRRRFLIFMLVRLFGLVTFLVGIAIAYSDLVREGGWPALGAIFAIAGALDAVFAPKLLKKHWDQEDRR
ncbi:MAG: hypothetical protein QOE14_1004 [Humisphaera sp.]|nr:hypothetical protein [Humisphaera sp.]